jgi:membrane protease YdiL (CAAX protease family)
MQSRNIDSIRAPILAILLFQTFALIARSFLQNELVADGMSIAYAKNLSYLIVPPILCLTMYTILKQNREFLRTRFSLKPLSAQTIIVAISIGILLRLAWWGHLIAFAAFGIYRDDDPTAIIGPLVSFSCPPAQFLLLHVLVLAILIPLVEETINRGFLLYTFLNKSRLVAIVSSSILFAIFHIPGTMPFAFVIGLYFAVYALNTGSLWLPAIAHATYNALIALDWLCLQIIWNPNSVSPKLAALGSLAAILLVSALLAVKVLVCQKRAPGRSKDPARS